MVEIFTRFWLEFSSKYGKILLLCTKQHRFYVISGNLIVSHHPTRWYVSERKLTSQTAASCSVQNQICFSRQSIIEHLPSHRRALAVSQPSRFSFFFFLESSTNSEAEARAHVHAGSSNREEDGPCIMYNTSRYWFPQWFHPLPGVIVYRGTAWHGLVKHKHRETINKRNVARMPRHVSLSRWNTTERKCPRSPLPAFLALSFPCVPFSRIHIHIRTHTCTPS